MKAIIKSVHAIYAIDGSGYNMGDPISIYPFKSAAEASTENKNLDGYSSISQIELIEFEDVKFILHGKIKDKDIIGKDSIKIGVPQKCYLRTGYGVDTICIVGGKNLINYLEDQTSYSTISKSIIIRDIDSFYLLKSMDSFTIKPFIMSRELAIKNDLGKLTEEERKLLGL